MDTSVALLSELRECLGEEGKLSMTKHVFVGFDGFVDKIKKAVKQKNKLDTVYYNTLNEFSERIDAASGKSGQVEMVTEKIKLGGNAPILADTLGKLGVQSTCLGSMGYPKIHEVFGQMDEKCRLISVLNPGESDAIEFDDGKMIFSELSVYDKYDWEYIRNTVDLDEIRQAVRESNLIAFVNWVNLPHASDIWTGMLNDLIKPSGKKDFLFLFDLSDPSKKSAEEIDEVLGLMSSFFPYGKVTLGINENEALKIWAAINRVDLSQPGAKSKLPAVQEAGRQIYQVMNIDYLLIHPVDRTILFHQGDVLEMPGRLVTEPKVLTGGGDNLNAGYCVGLMSGFSLPLCMLLGMAASGAYIQNGKSPDVRDIKDYIGIWIDELSKNVRENEHLLTE
ncbi:hypothetical protein GCM10009122_53080 [Fulvivirga kasyanovii]|uniref:Carbohydrate kinase PfkB domain-containing protein n=1 Tax=Fulvivirga kasyanovii TaxID=396812 RepID=A0ABW9RTL5_9BACT|nr:hypothetical protein [Fulvivirga kasyanovii]MTI26628.1 hypothetical protein [Fulvivirga kasyanovii]